LLTEPTLAILVESVSFRIENIGLSRRNQTRLSGKAGKNSGTRELRPKGKEAQIAQRSF
jgi:hypothetical protein